MAVGMTIHRSHPTVLRATRQTSQHCNLAVVVTETRGMQQHEPVVRVHPVVVHLAVAVETQPETKARLTVVVVLAALVDQRTRVVVPVA